MRGFRLHLCRRLRARAQVQQRPRQTDRLLVRAQVQERRQTDRLRARAQVQERRQTKSRLLARAHVQERPRQTDRPWARLGSWPGAWRLGPDQMECSW